MLLFPIKTSAIIFNHNFYYNMWKKTKSPLQNYHIWWYIKIISTTSVLFILFLALWTSFSFLLKRLGLF